MTARQAASAPTTSTTKTPRRIASSDGNAMRCAVCTWDGTFSNGTVNSSLGKSPSSEMLLLMASNVRRNPSATLSWKSCTVMDAVFLTCSRSETGASGANVSGLDAAKRTSDDSKTSCSMPESTKYASYSAREPLPELNIATASCVWRNAGSRYGSKSLASAPAGSKCVRIALMRRYSIAMKYMCENRWVIPRHSRP